MISHTHIAGGLVTLFATLYVESLARDVNRLHPKRHVLFLIAASTLTMPYVFLTSPDWYGFPMQLTFNLLVLILDWFSFHEDKSRFSEEKICIFGNCRKNAMYTGHLAHWGDILGILAVLIPFVEHTAWRLTIIVGLLVYGIIGSDIIDAYTQDGSVSDLRALTPEKRCEQARLMRDGWRGALNDLITVLGVGVAWQALMNCTDSRCEGIGAPFKLVAGLFTETAELVSNRDGGSLKRLKRAAPSLILLVVTILTTIVPTYANYVNTSAQHGITSSAMYNLPSCYDDNIEYDTSGVAPILERSRVALQEAVAHPIHHFSRFFKNFSQSATRPAEEMLDGDIDPLLPVILDLLILLVIASLGAGVVLAVRSRRTAA